ncbi:MAG: hypothetical protein ACI9UK_001124 [Candidatus Krumholzibacteriia bacterium]|jgi:hypothetical protein
MINRRISYSGLLFTAVLFAFLMTGCRAFEPEAVVVNKAPETFIIGAPLEDGGGYYRFHVFWYGADSDGVAERFVWALTDTTLQDPLTTIDEEDQNFNPALDATTLEIANWTTKTDSIFNFTIDQGVNPSYDMTLHMVAIDDFGDFDRTPARLHFFSNTLGNPEISFFRIAGGDTFPIIPDQPDTVGYGFPFQVYWAGSSPNVRGFDPAALAAIDTVAPFDDGLFGYKWRLLGDLGDNCLPSIEDCWHPRRFNEATGDSFSFFGSSTSLVFENDGSGTGPFSKLLESGEVNMEVNSIDVAGVEVADFRRPISFVVNYDPQTRLLDGEQDWAHPSDPEVYPYYIQLNDPTRQHIPFQSGDRIPDRTYVVFKALSRDDPRDAIFDESFRVGFTGFVKGKRQNLTGAVFSFSTESSDLNSGGPDGSRWDATCDTCWYADTLGFLTGPRTEFVMNAQALDKHGRRDGTPAQITFDVGYEPCLQCLEFLPKESSTSAWTPALECTDDYPDPSQHPCFQDIAEMRVTQNPLPGDDFLQYKQNLVMLVDRQTYFVQIAESGFGFEQSHYIVPARLYSMSVLMHGSDDPREAWDEPVRRIMGWQYEVNYDCDEFNQIKDGGGNDDIKEPTWGGAADGVGLAIDNGSGLWRMGIDVVVPELLFNGPDGYLLFIQFVLANQDPEVAQAIFDATTKQFGLGTMSAIALDQTTCFSKPTRPGLYNYFKKVRPSVGVTPGFVSWRNCNLSVPGLVGGGLPLSRGAMQSNGGNAISKDFRLIIETASGDFTCELP